MRGNPKYVTSYRSELAGLISLMKYIKKEGYDNTPIEMWYDNKAVVNILNNEEELNITDLDMAEPDLVEFGKDLMK